MQIAAIAVDGGLAFSFGVVAGRMIKHFAIIFALFGTPLAAQTPPPPEPQLTLDHHAALRCSALFAIVAADQSRGTKWALAYPPLHLRGREYFVRTGARLLDDTGLNRTEVQALFQREAATLRSDMARTGDSATVFSGTMPLCLELLETTIPVVAGRTP
ncbi:MAG TPA: hypothetical protein VHG29_03925 [Novosphingobium sp.]|nr:hypothetical protein [Novosphingobium sp.]